MRYVVRGESVVESGCVMFGYNVSEWVYMGLHPSLAESPSLNSCGGQLNLCFLRFASSLGTQNLLVYFSPKRSGPQPAFEHVLLIRSLMPLQVSLTSVYWYKRFDLSFTFTCLTV